MSMSPARRWWDRARHAAGACRTYVNPMTRFLDYLGRVPAGEVREVRLRNGLRVRARLGTSDLAIVDEVFAHGVYDRALRTLAPGQAVLDIGAQSGIFALAAAARGASVLCCEPIPANAALLARERPPQRVRGPSRGASRGGGPDRGHAEPVRRGRRHGRRHRVSGAFTRCGSRTDGCGRSRSTASRSRRCSRRGRTARGTASSSTAKAPSTRSSAGPGPRRSAGVRALILEYHPNGDVAALARGLEARGFAVEVSGRPSILWARRAGGGVGA